MTTPPADAQPQPPTGEDPPGGQPPVDVLALDLAGLRTVEHPLLRAVLDDLRDGAAEPGEMLWGYGSAF
jgi:FXSXX-COOH protein